MTRHRECFDDSERRRGPDATRNDDQHERNGAAQSG